MGWRCPSTTVAVMQGDSARRTRPALEAGMRTEHELWLCTTLRAALKHRTAVRLMLFTDIAGPLLSRAVASNTTVFKLHPTKISDEKANLHTRGVTRKDRSPLIFRPTRLCTPDNAVRSKLDKSAQEKRSMHGPINISSG